MTKILRATLLFCAMAACSDSSGGVHVAVILPSPIDDHAFSQSMFEALRSVRDERGAAAFDFTYRENVTASDAEPLLRRFAGEGYDLVIAHGLQYDAAATAAARAFPSTAFALGTSSDAHGVANLYVYDARAGEGGYVNGVMAAKLSKSGKLGVVGPIEEGDAASYVNGFLQGARDTVPGIDVRVTWVGSFDDSEAAARAAREELAAGADVLTGVSQLVVGAIGEARQAGVPWFGTQWDQAPLAPSLVVASQVYRWEDVLGQMSDAAAQGARNRSFVIDLANRGEEIVFNPAAPLPADVRRLADETIARVANGSVAVKTAVR